MVATWAKPPVVTAAVDVLPHELDHYIALIAGVALRDVLLLRECHVPGSRRLVATRDMVPACESFGGSGWNKRPPMSIHRRCACESGMPEHYGGSDFPAAGLRERLGPAAARRDPWKLQGPRKVTAKPELPV